MKKYINLLYHKKEYQKKQKILLAIIFFLMIIDIIFFSLFISISYQFFKNQREYKDLIIEKENILNLNKKNAELQVKINYISNYSNHFFNLLDNDLNFLPYYEFIKKKLESISPEIKITQINFDKNNNFKFLIFIPNIETLINFLNLLEDPEFKSNFNRLNLISLILSNKNLYVNDEKNDLIINLEGQFNKISNNKNEKIFF